MLGSLSPENAPQIVQQILRHLIFNHSLVRRARWGDLPSLLTIPSSPSRQAYA